MDGVLHAVASDLRHSSLRQAISGARHSPFSRIYEHDQRQSLCDALRPKYGRIGSLARYCVHMLSQKALITLLAEAFIRTPPHAFARFHYLLRALANSCEISRANARIC